MFKKLRQLPINFWIKFFPVEPFKKLQSHEYEQLNILLKYEYLILLLFNLLYKYIIHYSERFLEKITILLSYIFLVICNEWSQNGIITKIE